MRLICPNCHARYEVPEENIPATGRDVQCSACYNTWFQMHPEAKVAIDTSSDKSDHGSTQPSEPVFSAAITDFIKEQAVPPQPAYNVSPSDSTAEVTHATKNLKDDSIKRRLHPTVAEVLREEARREAEVRAAETLQARKELGPDETTQFVATKPNAEENGNAPGASNGDATSQSNIKKLEEDFYELLNEDKLVKKQTPVIDKQDDEQSSRSELVSNIGDKNAAVSFDEEAIESSLEDISLKKTGRLGFVIGLLVIASLFSIYQYEDRIASAYAPLSPVMGKYVSFVDRMRGYSDQSLHSAIAWLEFQVDWARQDETQQ